MFNNRITLFKLAGFRIQADFSWVFIAFLVTWSLATGVFPSSTRGLSQTVYLLMGAAGALGLFFSIIVHELAHSLVARKFGIEISSITLFIFGGVAQMDDEPPSPRSELLMAAAGPIASILLGALLFGIHRLAVAASFPLILRGVLGYLWTINLVLAAFNLVPAFPLDGGRILRSSIWAWKKSLILATKTASFIGTGFGYALMAAGAYFVVRGNFVNGIWWILIGVFLRGASRTSYRNVLLAEGLKGEAVSRFMREDPTTVPHHTRLDSLVEDYIYKYRYRLFPVVKTGLLTGCVTTEDVKRVPKEEWVNRIVADITQPISESNTVPPDMSAFAVLRLMRKSRADRLLVAENGHLLGIVTMKDLLSFLSLKLDLERPQPG